MHENWILGAIAPYDGRLKLAGIIALSWWWIAAIPLVGLVVIIGIVLLVAHAESKKTPFERAFGNRKKFK